MLQHGHKNISYNCIHLFIKASELSNNSLNDERSSPVGSENEDILGEREDGDGADFFDYDIGSKENPLNECFGSISLSLRRSLPKT